VTSSTATDGPRKEARSRAAMLRASDGKPWTSQQARNAYTRELADAAVSFATFWRNLEQHNARRKSPRELAVARVLRALTIAYVEHDEGTLTALEAAAIRPLNRRPVERTVVDVAGILGFEACDLLPARGRPGGPGTTAPRTLMARRLVNTIEWWLRTERDPRELADIALGFMRSPFGLLPVLAEFDINGEECAVDAALRGRLARRIKNKIAALDVRDSTVERRDCARVIAHATLTAVGLSRDQARDLFGKRGTRTPRSPSAHGRE